MQMPDQDWWTVHTGEYVLGLLNEQDTTVLERVMQHEPDVVNLVTDWGNLFQPLSDSLTPIDPPEHILPALLDNLPQQTRRSASTDAANAATHGASDSSSGSAFGSAESGDTVSYGSTHRSTGIDDGASVMGLLKSKEQQTTGWRTFAGLVVAGILLLGLYFGWSYEKTL